MVFDKSQNLFFLIDYSLNTQEEVQEMGDRI